MKAPASGPPVVWDDTLHPMLISRLNRFLGVGSRALLAATILLVSGCAGPSDPLSGSAATLSGRPPVVNLPEATEDSALPPPIVEEGFVRYSHGNPVYPSRDYYDACQAPMQCFSYPFEVKVNATMDARVTWGQDTSIFDLQLFFANSTRAALREGGDKLGERVTNPDTRLITRLVFSLAPGEYRVQVEAYRVVVPDRFVLAVSFDRPGLTLLDRPFFLTASRGLTEEAPQLPEPEEVPLPRPLTETRPFASEGVVFEGSALPDAFHAHRILATIYYRMEQGSGLPFAGDYGFVLDFGTRQISTAHIQRAAGETINSPEGAQALASSLAGTGDTSVLELTFNVPLGGLVLPAGTQPALRIATGLSRGEDDGRIIVLANSSATPSHILLQGLPISLDPFVAEEAFTDHVVTPPHPSSQPFNVCYTQPLTLAAADLGFRAQIRYAGPEPGPDLDIQLRDAEGNPVVGGWSMRTEEGLEIFAPNLEFVGAGDFVLRVLCQLNAGVHEFDVDAWIFRPA